MAETTKLHHIKIGGTTYGLGITTNDFYEELGLTLDRYAELLSRDFYCPTLSSAPTSSTVTYIDTDGSTNHFAVGQACRWKDGDGQWQIAFLKSTDGTTSQ